MARYRGTFTAAANYEPLKAAPFDARQLVETKSDLINPSTWQQLNGDIWTYIGMMVVVSSDVNSNNNGLYILKDKDYTIISNWEKQATNKEISALQAQIDELEVSGGGSLDVEVEMEADLPENGNSNTTYYVRENNTIWRWQEETQSYVSFGGSSADLDINIIHGGDANGNN